MKGHLFVQNMMERSKAMGVYYVNRDIVFHLVKSAAVLYEFEGEPTDGKCEKKICDFV